MYALSPSFEFYGSSSSQAFTVICFILLFIKRSFYYIESIKELVECSNLTVAIKKMIFD